MKSTDRYPVVFASEARADLLCAALPDVYVRVTNRVQLMQHAARCQVVFVDSELLLHIDPVAIEAPIIALIDKAPAETLPRAVRALGAYPWLTHFLSISMLSTPIARTHLALLLDRIASGRQQRMLGQAGVGRVALLARASRREARFERVREFFSKQGLTDRTITAIQDVYEELVTNALYDAPVEAGYFSQAIPRTEDVDLPRERACEISYGVEQGTVYVRVRDTFGALTRPRLLDVLNRCNASTVQLDESRGGAGLGIWRVFSAASTLSINVIPGRLTDILVGMSTKDGRLASKQLFAVHMFFAPQSNGGLSYGRQDDSDLLDQSITLELVA